MSILLTAQIYDTEIHSARTVVLHPTAYLLEGELPTMAGVISGLQRRNNTDQQNEELRKKVLELQDKLDAIDAILDGVEHPVDRKDLGTLDHLASVLSEYHNQQTTLQKLDEALEGASDCLRFRPDMNVVEKVEQLVESCDSTMTENEEFNEAVEEAMEVLRRVSR
jgi:hypothetical protein